MKKLLVLGVIMLSVFLTGCQSSQGNGDNSGSKKGILVISFGTSYAKTRKATIGACEKKIKKAFPGYEIRRAFTSNIIIKILKERDKIFIDTPGEALEKMSREGFSEVIIQPLHVIAGEEYTEKVLTAASSYKNRFKKLAVGRPILVKDNDYEKAVKAVSTQLPSVKEGEGVILMGHGTHHPANSSYAKIQKYFDDAKLGVYVGTVEASPDLNDVISALERDKIKKVTLMPFMVVAGDHASNDMAGDEDDSWKTILEKKGYEVKIYLHGLGENKEIQNIYVNHVRDAINK